MHTCKDQGEAKLFQSSVFYLAMLWCIEWASAYQANPIELKQMNPGDRDREKTSRLFQDFSY